MKYSGHLALVAFSLVIAACAGRDDTVGDTTDPMGGMAMGDTAAGAAGAMRVTLSPVENSGVSGEATLTASGEQTMISVHVEGAPANATLPAHIHSGTCEAKGPPVAPLDSVRTDGTGMAMANATVSLPLTTVANGQHFVQIHLPGGQAAACGNITSRM